MKRLLMLFIAGIAALILTGCGSTSSNEILIGFYCDLSGSTAAWGQIAKQAVELGVEEINSAGGINGKKVKVIFEDDRGIATESRNAVTKLIDKDGVAAVIGQLTSSHSLAGGEICQQRGIPMVSPAATNPEVTAKGDNIFRVCFIDTFQGSVLANFASKTLKAKRAAMLVNNQQDYSVGLAKFFKEGFTKLGGDVVIELNYGNSDQDFRAQLTTIKSKNPDVVLVPGYYTDTGSIARQAREIGLTAPFLGGDGWDDSEKLLQGAGNALEGCYFTTHFAPDQADAYAAEFVKKFKEKYQRAPNAMCACSYDAFKFVCDAIKRAGSTDPMKLREALSTTRDFQGVTGRITMDINRNAEKQAVVLQVKGDKFIYVQTITPKDLQEP